MKESSQREIELKGVTAKGLEKVLEVIYTSTTQLEADDIFDVIAAATHLQATAVISFCERNFLSGMTTTNFYDFISTAKLYNMNNALQQIDNFIAKNLLQIARDSNLQYLTFEQMMSCVKCRTMKIQEIDLFEVVWEWIRGDKVRSDFAVPLMTEIRFLLIDPTDLVCYVQKVDEMMSNPELRQMVLEALNYHVVPHTQPMKAGADMGMRAYSERIVSIGGREIHPHPGLSNEVHVFDANITAESLTSRKYFVSLPTALSHCQIVVFNNFLYVIGGCSTQCAHGETAVNTVLRFDTRFESWLQICPMLYKRAYFAAGVLNNKIYAIGGKQKDGSISASEVYDPVENSWENIAPLPTVCHAHAGVVYGQHLYITGGYSNNNFYGDMQRYDPISNQWEDMEPMQTPRGWHVMCVAKNKFYVLGGCNLNANHQALPVLMSECYDPETGQWTQIAPLSISHKEASCVVYRDSIYVLGGYNVQTKTGQKMVSRYDLYSGTWETIGALSQSMTGVGYSVLKLSDTLNQELL